MQFHPIVNSFDPFYAANYLGMKTNCCSKVVQKRAELTPADKIKILEEQRTSLVVKRMGIEKKIQQLEMREAGATREESMVGMERKRGE